jgi:magnesium-transporting ATPase (P-type)
MKLYCKGADNVVRERATAESLARVWPATESALRSFGAEGLRTLVVAYRELSDDAFDQWIDAHTRAKASMNNRAAEEAASAANIDRDLSVLGTTAIEDRLQEGVPETIERLGSKHGAAIRIWVLTGDKVETAINIGRSCRLLTPLMADDQLIVMDIDESLPDAEARVRNQHSTSATALPRTAQAADPFVCTVVTCRAVLLCVAARDAG